MVCKICPVRKSCLDKGTCENCDFGKAFCKLKRKIEKLERENEALKKENKNLLDELEAFEIPGF